MKSALITVISIAAILMIGMWIVFDVEEAQPKQNEMRNGCVYQKSMREWIRTCG